MVCLSEFFDEGESEACSSGFSCCFGAEAVELFEDFFSLSVWDTRSVVFDFDEYVSGIASCSDGDGFILCGACVFYGVVE